MTKKFAVNYYNQMFGHVQVESSKSDYNAKVEAARKFSLPEEAITLTSVPTYDCSSIVL